LKLSHGGSIFANDVRGPQIWVVGGRLGWGNLGFRSWVHAIERCSRGGLLGANSQNRAVRARFGQTTCKGGLYCGKGDLGVVGEVQLNGVGAVIGLVHSRGGVYSPGFPLSLPFPIPFPLPKAPSNSLSPLPIPPRWAEDWPCAFVVGCG
jgi:hypothetical protein